MQTPMKIACASQARVGDGLEAVAQKARQEEAGLDVVVVDASGGDPTQAMTCPPAAFLERRFLQDAHRCLSQEGLLIMNCVCRSQTVFDSAVSALQVRAAITHCMVKTYNGLRRCWISILTRSKSFEEVYHEIIDVS